MLIMPGLSFDVLCISLNCCPIVCVVRRLNYMASSRPAKQRLFEFNINVTVIHQNHIVGFCTTISNQSSCNSQALIVEVTW